jgi:hypothetical protein
MAAHFEQFYCIRVGNISLQYGGVFRVCKLLYQWHARYVADFVNLGILDCIKMQVYKHPFINIK